MGACRGQGDGRLVRRSGALISLVGEVATALEYGLLAPNAIESREVGR